MTLPNCRLFLVAPSTGNATELAACLKVALDAGDAASLLLPADEQIVRKLMPVAHEKDLAVLIEGNAEMAEHLGADGVHIAADTTAYSKARAVLGPAKIVGVDCGGDRHRAMEMGEAGADYIMLDQTRRIDNADPLASEPLIGWWAQVMELPCVAGRPAPPDDLAELARMAVDFVRPLDDMWQDPQHACRIVSEANDAIAAVSA